MKARRWIRGGGGDRGAMAVALAALVVALGGTAVAGTADSVVSEDIVDGEVRSEDVGNDDTNRALETQDVANGALTGADVATAGLTGADIRFLTGTDVLDNNLTGADVAGLTGADVNETSLGQIGNAAQSERLGGVAPSSLVIARGDGSDAEECTGTLPDGFETCADATVTFPRPARAVVLGSGGWHTSEDEANASEANARCRLTGPVSEPQTQTFGQAGAWPGHTEDFELQFMLHEVTDVVPAGSHEFEMDCMRVSGGTSDIDNAQITVLVVGAG